MKIFTAAQIQACDAYTMQACGIQSLELMERAAGRCVDWIRNNFPKEALFVILCGTGNNGGDGLAIARMLHHRQYGVKAFLLHFGKELSPDCYANLERLKRIDENLVTVVEPETYITDLPQHIVIIDAILGTGLSRPAEGWIGKFISHINNMPNRKIAIDLPSGMPADTIPDAEAPVLAAQDTLSFQFYKRTFLHPETAPFAGNIHIIDIGLDKTFIQATHTQYKINSFDQLHSIYKPRLPFAHKGTYGHALLIGGSFGKIGAISLSTKAALRAGAGLATALVPKCGYEIVQSVVPEAMCMVSGTNEIESITDWEKYSAIGVGPGMGTNESSARALINFIDQCKQPLVIDADALNIMAGRHELLAKLPKDSIITPHPKEFSRLFGENTNSMIQVDNARIQAMRYNINIVLKGHHTAIINSEGECWYNMTGNPGMATGGAGDVLTGFITGLLAQGYSSAEAAMMGVYLHGMAGDIGAEEISEEALIAGDIIEYLGKAFIKLSAGSAS